MPSTKPSQATVRHALLVKKTVPEALSTLGNVCSAGAQCTEVTGAPIGAQTLAVLKSAVTTAQASLTTKQSLVTALLAAAKALRLDFGAVKVALVAYEAAVGVIAGGNASVINKAGLLSRDQKTPAAALGKVTVVHTKPGKHPTEAILSWPAGPGATGYAIEVNFTPQNPTGTWVGLTSGSSRRRVVKGPTPGCQFLARVASLGSDGTQADWSDAVLATAL